MSWVDKQWKRNPRSRNKPCVKCGGFVTVITRGRKMIRQCQVKECGYEEEDR